MVVLGIFFFLWIPMALQGGALILHFKKSNYWQENLIGWTGSRAYAGAHKLEPV